MMRELLRVGRLLPAGKLVTLVAVSSILAAAASLAAHGLRARRATSAGAGSGNATVLHVPHRHGSIVLDGDTDDPGWTAPPGPARTGPFLLRSGSAARPYSDARLVWGDGHLYVALYAADEDIRASIDPTGAPTDTPLSADDSFRLVFTSGDAELAIQVKPSGATTDAALRRGERFASPWNSGAHVSYERDGTLNDPTDADEEWIIEMAIPFESLGMRGERGEHIGFMARRCDTPKRALPVCASWGDGQSPGQLVLE
jgi:hypothetical protein